MIVYLNGLECPTKEEYLLSFLDQEKLSNKSGIAVALNESVVQKGHWGETKIKENDKILVITATQGG